MDDVSSFEIEEGSCLESIEAYGLSWMSYENYNDDNRKIILVLPSTVTNIAANGLYWNNLFKTIYYCGSTHLINYCNLENGVRAPRIKVTCSYSQETIFRDYKPKNDSSSIAEAEEKCKNFVYKPESTPSHSVSPSISKLPGVTKNMECSQVIGGLHLVFSLVYFFSLSLSCMSFVPEQLSLPTSLSPSPFLISRPKSLFK